MMNFIIQQMSVRTDWNGDVDLLFQSLLDSNIFMLFVKCFSYSCDRARKAYFD